jgi:hypothetical protein
MLILAVVAASAAADESSGTENQAPPAILPPTALDFQTPAESELTDPQAAALLPHRDLDRGEAIALMTGVFEPQLQSPAGPFDDLQVERFLTDYVAVVGADSQPEPSGVIVGQEDGDYDGPTLVDSTVPLRTEDASGREAPIDLGLEHAEGELQPTNPVVDVGIPQELGEGIELPASGIRIELEGAPEGRVPSIVEQSVGVYPEVAEDTSLAVAPTPTGLETMTLLQSPDAPTTQTFHLDLPARASLAATADGGAEVVRDGRPILGILPPSALDATGANVPVSLNVAGDSLMLQASPSAANAFPILVDPIYQEYRWRWDNTWAGLSDWVATGNTNSYVAENHVACASPCPAGLEPGYPGLYLGGRSGSVSPGSQKAWNYYVPRWSEEWSQYGTPPTSFIHNMVVQAFGFWPSTDKNPSPAVAFGIWNWVKGAWTAGIGRWGNEGDINNFATTYTFDSGQTLDTKQAAVTLLSSDHHSMTAERQVYLGFATIALGDYDIPTFASITSPPWVKPMEVAPIGFQATDTGLGVAAMRVTMQSNPIHSWKTSEGCTGVQSNPCPRSWKSSEPGQPPLQYDLSNMQEGINNLKVTAEDPVGNVSQPVTAQIKVDGKAPELTVSGTPASGGDYEPVVLPNFKLKVKAVDGTTAKPQSGVGSVEVLIDGNLVKSATCQTENCEISHEWEIPTAPYSVGSHTVLIKALDRVNRETSKAFSFQIHKDTTAPELTSPDELLETSLVGGPSGWVGHETYDLTANATDAETGVRKVEVLINGVLAQGAKTTCSSNACTINQTYAIDTSPYAGGQHTVKLLAEDGRGLVASKSWTIRVDPSGDVSTADATSTLEAVEETSEAGLVAPGVAPEHPGDIPGLEQSGETIESTGTDVVSVMTIDPADGITIEAPQDAMHIEPVEVDGDATSIEVTAGAAAVSANTAASVDSVVRPIFDGVTAFQAIRDASAPEQYSWTVELGEGQTLVETESGQAANVFLSDGTAAMAIIPQPAHDATGANVDTSLSVSEGNVLTLTVHHQSKSYVYPVVGGANYKTGYESVTIYTPPPPPPPPEGKTPAELESSVINSTLYAYVSAPEPVGKGNEHDASASAISTYRKKFDFRQCEERTWPFDGCSIWEQRLKGHFYFNGRHAWWKKEQASPQCPHDSGPGYDLDLNFCDWAGPNHQKYGGGYHITAQVFYDVAVGIGDFGITHEHAITARLFGSGGAYPHKDEWCICNPST